MTSRAHDTTVGRIAYALVASTFLFGLLAWGYVVAVQLALPCLLYGPLAEWVPIRLDYFGEAAFILSIMAYLILKFWQAPK